VSKINRREISLTGKNVLAFKYLSRSLDIRIEGIRMNIENQDNAKSVEACVPIKLRYDYTMLPSLKVVPQSHKSAGGLVIFVK
jgi:hypothetical protein